MAARLLQLRDGARVVVWSVSDAARPYASCRTMAAAALTSISQFPRQHGRFAPVNGISLSSWRRIPVVTVDLSDVLNRNASDRLAAACGRR